MTKDMLAELEDINKKGGVHYYVYITDMDTGLQLKVDQTGDGNVEAPIEMFRVLYTKLNLFVNKGISVDALRLRIDVSDIEYVNDEVVNTMLKTVFQGMVQNRRAIYGQ
jgi:hypothetical protein